MVDGYPGLFHDVLTYLKERIKEVLTGAGATVVVRIFGPDLAVLRDKAHEVEAVMKGVEGVANLKVEQQILVPQLDVQLRPEAASRLGLTPGDVRRSATTLVSGTKVGELYKDQKIFASSSGASSRSATMSPSSTACRSRRRWAPTCP